jgi:hypothetical protein
MERLVRRYVNLDDIEAVFTFIDACEIIDGTTDEEWVVCRWLQDRFAPELAARKVREAEAWDQFHRDMWAQQHP